MYPHERSLVKHLNGKPFALIGVNSDNDISIPQGLVKSGKVTWRSFQNDIDGKTISDEWGVTGWPTIYLIDGEGKIRYHNVRGPKLDEALAKLLEEVGETFPADEIHATTKEESERKFDDAAE
jgi:hypothetical protein